MLPGFEKGAQVGQPPGNVYTVTNSSVIGFGAGSAGVFVSSPLIRASCYPPRSVQRLSLTPVACAMQEAQDTGSGEIVAIKIIDRSREGARTSMAVGQIVRSALTFGAVQWTQRGSTRSKGSWTLRSNWFIRM